MFGYIFTVILLLLKLVEEMFLTLGHRFDNYEALVKSVTCVHERWTRRLGPAILDYAEELEMPPPPDEESESRCIRSTVSLVYV